MPFFTRSAPTRLAGLVLACCASVAFAEPDPKAAPNIERPTYQTQRFTEDWSTLAGHDLTATGDPLDVLKYIPLSDDGAIWVSFGGQARVRLEHWQNFGFGRTNDDNFVLGRLFFHSDIHIGEHVRVFLEGKSAMSTDRDLPGGKRTVDVDELDMHNFFAELTLPLFDDGSLTVRAGRQELLFGRQRLISPLDWANTRRAFDGVSAIVAMQDLKLTAFWTRTVPVQKYDFNDSDANTNFYGIYAEGKVPGTQISLDLYWLGFETDMAAFNGTMGHEQRHTVGGRVAGKIGDTGVGYDLEGAYQSGEVGSDDIDAFMVDGELNYTFADHPGSPRLHLGAGYASGDRSAGGDVQTFAQLFPLGHAYLGFIDLVGRQNVINLTPGLTVKPIDKLTVKLDGHLFWLADDSDALYNAGGGVVRAGGTGRSSEVGAEIDLLLIYQIDRHQQVIVGYSHFFAGPFIKQSGGQDDIDFAYLGYQFTF